MTEKGAEPATARERIREALRERTLGARDLSTELGLSEREVEEALPHVARSVEAAGGKLVVTPAECAACGFSFRDRRRPGKPSRCPKCRATRVRAPRFRVDEKG